MAEKNFEGFPVHLPVNQRPKVCFPDGNLDAFRQCHLLKDLFDAYRSNTARRRNTRVRGSVFSIFRAKFGRNYGRVNFECSDQFRLAIPVSAGSYATQGTIPLKFRKGMAEKTWRKDGEHFFPKERRLMSPHSR